MTGDMKPLGIGLIGAGAIAQRNGMEAARSGAARIVGVFDVNGQAARDLARKLSTRSFATGEELLDAPDVEAVLISLPHHLHRPLAEQAAARGRHVMVEKPLANTLADGEALIAACRNAGVALTVNYSFRYLPKIQKARALVTDGALGTITGLQIVLHQYKDRGYWAGARSNSPDDWRASKDKAGGGFLIMNACHVIDYLYFVTGLRAVRVYSEYATLGSPADVEDVIGITVRFDNGGVGTVSASSIMRGMDQSEERVWGTNGTLVLSGAGLSWYSTRPVDGRRPGTVHHLKKFPEASWTAEWVRRFHDAVRRGDTPDIPARVAWENLAFIDAAYRSLDEGRPVDVPPWPGDGT